MGVQLVFVSYEQHFILHMEEKVHAKQMEFWEVKIFFAVPSKQDRVYPLQHRNCFAISGCPTTQWIVSRVGPLPLWVWWVHLWPCTGRWRRGKDFLCLSSQSQTLTKLAPTSLKLFEVFGWNVQSTYGMCYGCMECGGYYSSLLLKTQDAHERHSVLTWLNLTEYRGKNLPIPL